MRSYFLVHNLQEENPSNGIEITVINIFINFYNHILSISSKTNNCHDFLVMDIPRSNLEKLPCFQEMYSQFPVNMQQN